MRASGQNEREEILVSSRVSSSIPMVIIMYEFITAFPHVPKPLQNRSSGWSSFEGVVTLTTSVNFDPDSLNYQKYGTNLPTGQYGPDIGSGATLDFRPEIVRDFQDRAR